MELWFIKISKNTSICMIGYSIKPTYYGIYIQSSLDYCVKYVQMQFTRYTLECLMVYIKLWDLAVSITMC